MQTRIMELVALAVLAFFIWDGWKQGVAAKTYHLVKYVIRTIIVMIAMPILLPVLPKELEGRMTIAFLICWVIGIVIVEIIAKIIGVVERIPEPDGTSKRIGAILGAVYGIAILWILLLILGSLGEMDGYKMACDWARGSSVLMGLNKLNPLVYLMKMYQMPIL